MKKYRLLILSNGKGSALTDDLLLKASFETDGHKVDIQSVDYDEKSDEQYDVIIRRNTWVTSEAETIHLAQANQKLIDRLKKKGIKTVNLEGLDGRGKGYLCDIFTNNDDVIPTVDSIKKMHLLPKAEQYVLKDRKSFGNGFFQKTVPLSEVKMHYNEGDIIQPLMRFQSEIQCYFVADKLLYVFEYTPSKFPNYPEPKIITFNAQEAKLAMKYAKYSNLKHGFQRIDFLKLHDGRLLLMEIEDHAPFMNLQRLPAPLQNFVIGEYKGNLYHLLEEEPSVFRE